MGLANQTYGGIRAIELSNEIVGRLPYYFGNFPDHETTVVDGIASINNVASFIYENKCRKASLIDKKIKYRGRFYNDYLISHNKIEEGAKLSKMLKLPFLIFIYFEENDTLAYFQVTNQKGKIMIDYDQKRSKTQNTVNGGVANRVNAFIKLSQIQVVKNYENQITFDHDLNV